MQLRLAECDYFLKQRAQARDGVRPFIDKASRQGEALFFYAVATRDLGDHDEYLRVVRRLVDEFPTQSWAEEALNNLATHYILQNDDESADQAFRELYEKFPTGRYARARRVEDRLVGVQERPLRRDRARLRVGGGAVSALRLPAVVAVLVGARARGAERAGAGRRALHAGRDRLSEQLLRPPGA